MSGRSSGLSLKQVWSVVGVVACTWMLSACSSGPTPPKPASLPPVSGGLSIHQAWSVQLGAVDDHLRLSGAKGLLAMGSAKGQLRVVDAQTGALRWQAQTRAIGAGVGFDGQRVALINDINQLEVWVEGKRVWMQPLTARGFTPPLVAGERVFALTADRQLHAFDALTGRNLWSQVGSGEPLVLQSPGLLAAWGNTLLVGWGERLVGVEPLSGRAQWDIALTMARGTNEIERLRDAVAGVHAAGGVVCARSFNTAVTCGDPTTRQRLWSANRDGVQGVSGNEQAVWATDGSSRITGWSLRDGKEIWTQEALLHRQVTAPVVLGKSLAVGDLDGWVHWLSVDKGAIMARMPTDGSRLLAAPIVVGNTVVALTQRGGVYAWRTQ